MPAAPSHHQLRPAPFFPHTRRAHILSPPPNPPALHRPQGPSAAHTTRIEPRAGWPDPHLFLIHAPEPGPCPLPISLLCLGARKRPVPRRPPLPRSPSSAQKPSSKAPRRLPHTHALLLVRSHRWTAPHVTGIGQSFAAVFPYPVSSTLMRLFLQISPPLNDLPSS
jgi:hypothetical protein